MSEERRFEPKSIRRWRRDVWRVFDKEGFKPTEIMAGLVLAAVSAFGTDPDVLSEITGHSTEYVRKVLKRLRRERVLRGQTLRAAWGDNETGSFAVLLDGMVAAGIMTREINDKASAAQKARAPETRARGPRRPSTKVAVGAVFSPQIQKSNPLYGLPEWRTQKSSQSADAVDPSASSTGTGTPSTRVERKDV